MVRLLEPQLRDLVETVRRQEANHFLTMKYDRSVDMLKLQIESKEARAETLALIDTPKFHRSSDPKKQKKIDKVNYAFLEWVEAAAGLGIVMFQNVQLRRHYLKKVRAFADTMIAQGNSLAFLPPGEFEQEVRLMLEDLVVHADVVRMVTLFDASDATQRWNRPLLKGRTLEQVVDSYYSKLVEEGRFPRGQTFEQLGDLVKAQVYVEILLTWKPKTSRPELWKLSTKAAVGTTLVLFMLGMSVYDVYKAEHKAKKIFTEAAEFAGGYWGSNLGELVASTVARAAPALIAAPELSGPLLALLIFGTGCVAGYFVAIEVGKVAETEADLISSFAGWVHDKIIGSGGQHTGGAIVATPEERERHPEPDISNKMRFYRAPMPDSSVLARQIARKNTK